MKKFFICLMLCVFTFTVFSQGELESAQYQKELQAEQKGLLRVITVYENGNLIEEFQGYFNLETNQYTGVITITENRGVETIFIHKFWPSENTLIIIKEITE